MKTEVTTSGGISFLSALALMFIALKLMGYINWSWWLVLGPLWIPIAVGLVVFIACLLCAIVLDAVRDK